MSAANEDKERKGVDNLATPEPSWLVEKHFFRPAYRRGSPPSYWGVGGLILFVQIFKIWRGLGE